jgi:hypothetical protein
MTRTEKDIYDQVRNTLIRLQKNNINSKTSKIGLLKMVREILGHQVSGEPLQILTLFCQLYPVVEPRQSVSDGSRPYMMDRALTRAMLRCKDLPTQIGIN